MLVGNSHLVFKAQVREKFTGFEVVVDLVEDIRISHCSAADHDGISTDNLQALLGLFGGSDVSVSNEGDFGE